MIKIFWRHILPLVLIFAICEEVLFLGISLVNAKSDLAVVGGSLLILASIVTFLTFLVRQYAIPLIKELDQ